MSTKVAKRRWFMRPLPIAIVLAVIGGGSLFTFGDGGVWDSCKLRKTSYAQAEQIRQLEAQKKQLADYLTALKSGDEVALERAARELKLAASNETIYDIKVEPQKR
jgi:cell division protein FtsB